MSNSSIKSKTALLRNGETQKGNGYPEANDYSARILETMQTGVIFFNTEQIISGINNLACEDLQIPRDPSGHHFNHPPRKRYLPGTDRPIEVFGNGYGGIANRHFDTFSGNEGAILCQWVYHAVGDRTLFISIP